MGDLPDPLDIENLNKPRCIILSDNGIRSAMNAGIIETNPKFEESDSTRIQPATLDVKLREVEDCVPIKYIEGMDFKGVNWGDPHTLRAKSLSTINLTELIDFGQMTFYRKFLQNFDENVSVEEIRREYEIMSNCRFLSISTEARSSLRRLGIYMANNGGYFFSDNQSTKIELGNFAPNDVHFKEGDRIAQVFFFVDPYADVKYFQLNEENKKLKEKGELIRTFEMGIESTGKQLHELQARGFMEISPNIKTYRGMLGVHASSVAYRMKKIEGGIEFSKRDKYPKEDLLERIDISKGYTVQPYEHIIIETVENFKLSTHVGIRFWDNLLLAGTYNQLRKRNPWENIELCNLTDGWVDPGYSGGFSRQPKWLTGRKIKPGDVVGFGQVFFFPKGVGTSYGSAQLGSQYQNKEKTEFSK